MLKDVDEDVVTTQAVRSWSAKGLLPVAAYTRRGIRLYDVRDVVAFAAARTREMRRRAQRHIHGG
jgi:DNA-binding transcriptional MerR regulator